MVKSIVHLEGAVIFLAMIYLYGFYGFHWWIFILFLFAPDISILGYMVNNHVGAMIYNVCHTYIFSIIIFLCGLFFQQELAIAIGIIWTAHIGMDRLCGFGLKYHTAFKDTHLQKI